MHGSEEVIQNTLTPLIAIGTKYIPHCVFQHRYLDCNRTINGDCSPCV